MRIVINAVSWSKLIKGVDRYTIELIRHLAKIDSNNEYYIFYGRWQDGFSKLATKHNFKFFPIKWSSRRIFRHIWHSIFFPFLARRLRPDIVHLPNTMPLLFKAGKTIISIHDQLLEFSFPEKYGFFRSLARRLIVRMEADKSSHIIAVSSQVKKELVQKLGARPSKISVVLNGVNTEIFNPSLRSTPPFGIKKPYILFVSVIDKNKNLQTLVKGYNLLPSDLKRKYLLVVTGKKGNAYPNVSNLIQTLNIKERVIFVNHIADELPKMYANADLFVMPSIYEGFSLPVLEALASGVPVILSKTIAIADLLKDCVMTFDPFDAEELSEKIAFIISNQEYAKKLVQKGYVLTRSFSWLSTARATLELYNRVYGGKK